MGLLVWALLASLTAGYYYYSYNDLSNKIQKPVVNINIGINYGNATPTVWLNETRAKAGDTLLNATMLVAKVRYTVWLGSGAFVDSINNVTNSGSHYWLWWMHTAYGWYQGSIASDRYIVGDNETYFWYYEDTSIQPTPTPP
jgi:hypothetical protein